MRPTQTGWSTLGAGVAVYVLGVVLGYPELCVLAGALVLLVAAAFVWVLHPPTLAVERQLEPVRVRRGGAALGLVQVTNVGRRRAPRLRVEDRVGLERVTVELPPLRPAASHSTTYRLPTGRRGVFAVGPMVLDQTDPFGLVSRRRNFGSGATLWVHPRSHPVPAVRAGSTIEMDGPMDDTAPEGTIAFQGLRPYVEGDDLRMVHWRTTARTGTLMIKKHVDTNRPQVAVLLDDRSGSYPTPAWFEEAAEVAASLVEQALRAGAPVRLDTISGAVTEFVPTGARDALDLIAGLSLHADGSLARAVQSLEGETGGSVAVLISGDAMPDDPTSLDRLGGRYRRVSALLLGAETPASRRIARLEVCRAGGAAAVLALWQSGSGG
ncbi:DUF58 domain-containing protein [Acidiferrimicrobium sp. IK]|uniref:DUF58 domain-containing protein n=1 Tax=Acidiferrimicrobium sp. IK TaxID=2871700 RepID=UPI0021CAF38E|nr:DUF58 domain-containing protein [Acidiferrimicrobium sp. IK]MCU4187106.1 DUF58 domain-containing protein [Acidiferrimicrobium sp. IK]